MTQIGALLASDPTIASAEPELVEVFERRMLASLPRVTRLVQRLLAWPGHRAEVEDVVQDVFLAAWRARAEFRGNAQWSSWVHSIAIRQARNAARSRARRDRLWRAVYRLWPTTAEVDSPAEAAELDDEMRAALGGLAHADREILVLRYLEELTVGQITEQLDLGRAAVDARLSRARKRLRARLATEGSSR